MKEKDNYIVLDNDEKIYYDYLILSSGSHYSIPLLATDIFVNATDSSSLLDSFPKLLLATTVTVIGGGPVGVEVAGEICCKFPNIKLTLVSAREVLLERCCAKAHSNVYQFFSNYQNVSLVLGQKVSKWEDGGTTLTTNKGHVIKSDVTFACIGFTPNTQYVPKHMKNKFGQVLVNKHMQVLGNIDNYYKDGLTERVTFHKIFAVGDINNVHEEKLATSAESQANYVIQQINCLERSKSTPPYRPIPRKMIISLGTYYLLLAQNLYN